MRTLVWLAVLAVMAPMTSAQPADECACLWQGDFSEVQAEADLVVTGTIISRKGNSVDLALERILRGREVQETVRIWLQARDYCRPPAENFPPGSRWVMALYRINEEVPGGFDPGTPNISYGRIGDYRLSSCGGYWLELQDGWVTGNLVNAPRWERTPKMTPVLLDLLAAYVRGEVDRQALVKASREDPALRELMLDTREFLRDER
ncbi:delta-aminolevulinic acid dehydratase [Kineobactrum sediminis]|nr:delta-aminolevulinic acid dehydratase [Kineobactrum sediminis]